MICLPRLETQWVLAGFRVGYFWVFTVCGEGSIATCAAARYWRRFSRARTLPAAVRGPVLRPPCHLQRVLPGSLRAWQGLPSRRRRAPHERRSRMCIAHSQSRLWRRKSASDHPNLFARAREGGPSRAIRIAVFIWILLVMESLRKPEWSSLWRRQGCLHLDRKPKTDRPMPVCPRGRPL